VPDPDPAPEGSYRDARGALKRQAVRFRVYGYDKDGGVVGELTADNAVIDWTVHVANKKAAWYNFTLAMDIPEVRDPKVEPARRRNAAVKGADRQKLVIDPGPRSIHGRDTAGSTYHFDTGKFLGTPVYLGELRTDKAGRLVFLGGRGVSRSAYGARPYDFANNDGWHDDVSDGPVSARVWVGGREIPVEPAWVAVAPPNYAPELKSVRTLYDLYEDLPYTAGTDPGEVSFARHIQPILERMCGLQWVNLGFADQFGWRAPHEFVRADYLARLGADPNPANRANATEFAELRKQVFNKFRNYATNNGWRGLWPWVYGDAMDVDGAPHRDLALSNLQLARLQKWADGQFLPDYDPKAKPGRTLDDFDLADRPDTLTEAALSFCLADAFHPGCEITWVVRNLYLYRPLPPGARLPFLRFKVRPASLPEPDYGDVLVPQEALSSSGPLNSLGPGDLTRWMAVPWQTDTASCRAGYEQFTPSTPTFWPARVPNHVLTEDDYDKVMDGNLAPARRWEAFRRRLNWLRDLGRGFDSINRMVTEFGLLGLVERRKGPGGEFPDVLLVEVKPKAAPRPAALAAAAAAPPSLNGELAAPEANGVPEDRFFPKVKRLRNPLPLTPGQPGGR
jgi:hypothetical protein